MPAAERRNIILPADRAETHLDVYFYFYFSTPGHRISIESVCVHEKEREIKRADGEIRDDKLSAPRLLRDLSSLSLPSVKKNK